MNVKEQYLEIIDFRLYSKYYGRDQFEGVFLFHGYKIEAYWQRIGIAPGYCLN